MSLLVFVNNIRLIKVVNHYLIAITNDIIKKTIRNWSKIMSNAKRLKSLEWGKDMSPATMFSMWRQELVSLISN